MPTNNSQTTDQICVNVQALTDVGRVRSGNEDNFLVTDLNTDSTWISDTGDAFSQSFQLASSNRGFVCAVSDGMGGAAAGEVASRLAVSLTSRILAKSETDPALQSFPFRERLRLAIEQANLIIAIAAELPEYNGMGATFTAAGLHGQTLCISQVGDSRAYLIRNNHLVQITKDQSLVWQLYEMGLIRESELETHPQRNVILQALGAAPGVDVITQELALYRGDVILMCSDGLSGKVRNKQILKIVESSKGSLAEAAQKLVNAANDNGGEDNITVVLMAFDGEGLPQTKSGYVEVPNPVGRNPKLPRQIELDGLFPKFPSATDEGFDE